MFTMNIGCLVSDTSTVEDNCLSGKSTTQCKTDCCSTQQNVFGSIRKKVLTVWSQTISIWLQQLHAGELLRPLGALSKQKIHTIQFLLVSIYVYRKPNLISDVFWNRNAVVY